MENNTPIWSGGELTIILCDPMHRSEWHLCSLKNEGANVWHNAIGSVLQLWQRGEPTDAGQCRRCCAILCRRCHASQFERE
jgi:hypothetical protein